MADASTTSENVTSLRGRVPAHLVVQRLRIGSLLKIVAYGWFCGVGSLWFAFRALTEASVGIDLWFGYLIGAPLCLIIVVTFGHGLRSLARPLGLSVYYDPSNKRPTDDVILLRRLTWQSVHDIVTSGWHWGAGWLLLALLVYGFGAHIVSAQLTNPCSLIPGALSPGVAALNSPLAAVAPHWALVTEQYWLGLPGDILRLGAALIHASCNLTEVTFVLHSLIATALVVLAYVLVIPGGVAFTLYPGLRIRGLIRPGLRLGVVPFAPATMPNPCESHSVLTIIVHGTFAAEESWWRDGDDPNSFASRLESELSALGEVGTVWTPLLASDTSADEFRWSGANSDVDRRRGAARLSELLQHHARTVGATSALPIVLNVVAHSHGGNVALEILKSLPQSYFLNRLVMLGAPNLGVRPSFRIGRVLIAASYAFLVPLAVGATLYFLYRVLEGTFNVEEAIGLGLALFALVILNWCVIFVALLGDMLWHPFGRLVALLFGRQGPGVYGPSQPWLAKHIGAGRIFNLISRHDEASVLLRSMAAPGLLVKDSVASERRWLRRGFRKLITEPILRFLILKASETVGEVYVLGFSWIRVMFYDYDVARREFPYADKLVKRVDVTKRVARAADYSAARHVESSFPGLVWNPREDVDGATSHDMVYTFEQDRMTVMEFLKGQLKLLHSLYYQDPALTNLVAGVLRDGSLALAVKVVPDAKIERGQESL